MQPVVLTTEEEGVALASGHWGQKICPADAIQRGWQYDKYALHAVQLPFSLCNIGDHARRVWRI